MSESDNTGGAFAAAARTVPRLIASQRGLAYASEVGEAGRPVIHKWLVRALYGASFLYVGADTYHKAMDAHNMGVNETELKILVGDTVLFHALASMAVPALTIHSIVKYSELVLRSVPMSARVARFATIAPTMAGLCSIPFIIEPIDHAVEFAMDHTARTFYDRPRIPDGVE